MSFEMQVVDKACKGNLGCLGCMGAWIESTEVDI